MAIYKDIKRNTWYFRIYVRNSDGTRSQKTRSGYRTKSACIQAQSNFLLEYNENDKNDITFKELYKNYIKWKEQNLKYQSYRTIKNKFDKHILPFFENYKINNIKVNDYIKWKEYIINKNLKYKTNCSLHLCMVNILNFAYDFYDLKENIAHKVGNFKNNDYIEGNIDFWTFDEFNRFINCVNEKLYYVLFNVLFFTGMRLGEALALNWNDISDKKIKISKTLIRKSVNTPYFNTPKTKNSFRTILLDNKTYNCLMELKKDYESIVDFNKKWFVFGGLKPLSTTTIERKKNQYCKIANVKQIRLHDFRHSHATFLISNKIPITVVSKRLGHKDSSLTLKVYSHFIVQDEIKAISLLEQINQ